MKLGSVIRLSVAAISVFGAVLVVTSQPGSARQAGSIKHLIIPASVQMSHVQEFKDAATILLKDAQKEASSGGGLERGSMSKFFFVKTTAKDYISDRIFWFPNDAVGGSTGVGSSASQRATPADIAMLSYTFDEGIDIVMRNPATGASLTASPTMITGHISPKDMGMTYPQMRQMTAQYIDRHPMRFWNEARVGLAAGK